MDTTSPAGLERSTRTASNAFSAHRSWRRWLYISVVVMLAWPIILGRSSIPRPPRTNCDANVWRVAWYHVMRGRVHAARALFRYHAKVTQPQPATSDLNAR